MNDRLVWIDCEMTGLDIERDALIEIAVLVTDAQLNLLDDGLDLVITAADEALDRWSPCARHARLVRADRSRSRLGVTLADAEGLVLEYVKSHVPEPATRPCAATRSRRTAASSPATCPPWTRTCTTG